MSYQKQLPVAGNAILAKVKGVRGDFVCAKYVRTNQMRPYSSPEGPAVIGRDAANPDSSPDMNKYGCYLLDPGPGTEHVWHQFHVPDTS